jgi:hypothetical protein
VVNSEELIGTTECLVLQARCRINRCNNRFHCSVLHCATCFGRTESAVSVSASS